jgi:hypothetical protein
MLPQRGARQAWWSLQCKPPSHALSTPCQCPSPQMTLQHPPMLPLCAWLPAGGCRPRGAGPAPGPPHCASWTALDWCAARTGVQARLTQQQQRRRRQPRNQQQCRWRPSMQRQQQRRELQGQQQRPVAQQTATHTHPPAQHQTAPPPAAAAAPPTWGLPAAAGGRGLRQRLPPAPRLARPPGRRRLRLGARPSPENSSASCGAWPWARTARWRVSPGRRQLPGSCRSGWRRLWGLGMVRAPPGAPGSPVHAMWSCCWQRGARASRR